MVSQYVVGIEQEIDVQVYCENNGEDSFESQIIIQIPEGTDYNRMIKYEGVSFTLMTNCLWIKS